MEIYENQNRLPIWRWIVALVFAGGYGFLVYLVLTGNTAFIDDPVRNFVFEFRNEFLTMVFKGITFCAEPMTLLVLCVVLLVLPWTRMYGGIPLAVATGLGSLINKGAKALIDRPRPDSGSWLIEEGGLSFPSGHSNAAVIFYIFAAILIYRWLARKNNSGLGVFVIFLAVVLVLGIGLSRIYLGVHYPTDVVGGFLQGSILLIIMFSIYDGFYPEKYDLRYEDTGWKPL